MGLSQIVQMCNQVGYDLIETRQTWHTSPNHTHLHTVNGLNQCNTRNQAGRTKIANYNQLGYEFGIRHSDGMWVRFVSNIHAITKNHQGEANAPLSGNTNTNPHPFTHANNHTSMV